MVIDNALHTSIIIVWQPSFNWSRVCLHTYPINRYCFSSSRDVVFEIFHASHCHYILLKKIIPQNNMFIFGEDQFCSKETWLFWGRSHLSSQMTFWGAGGLHPYWMCTQSSSNLYTTSYDVVFFGDLLTNHHFSLRHHFIFISTHIMCKKSPCRQASRLDHVIFDWFTCKSLHYMGKIYSIDRIK